MAYAAAAASRKPRASTPATASKVPLKCPTRSSMSALNATASAKTGVRSRNRMPGRGKSGMLTRSPPTRSRGEDVIPQAYGPKRGAGRLGLTHDHDFRPDEALRRQDRRRRHHLHHRARPGDRIPRPERRRQVHHHAHGGRARPAERRHRDRQRQALRGPPRAAARGGRAAGRQGGPHRPHRLQPPAGDGRHARHRREARARGHRDDRPGVRREKTRRQVLARHGATARHRRGAARRPGRRSSSTSRSTASTRRACSGCANSPASSPPRAARSSSPRT